ncbi:MAG: hypothetical protein IPN18_11880 [Ignavibacteriales bacterium]|nr:hypothetical protein [Ignavibacteriales bacterium]
MWKSAPGFGRNGMTEVDNSRLTLVQFNPDGSQDLSFGNDGVFSGHQNHEKMICGVLLPDGSLLAGGYKAYYNYNYSTYILSEPQTGNSKRVCNAQLLPSKAQTTTLTDLPKQVGAVIYLTPSLISSG